MSTGCWLDRCGGEPYGLGLCKLHWQRIYRSLSPYPATSEDRFWSRVTQQGDCWVWTGYITGDGYGWAGVNGKSAHAHRLSYEQMVGEIPEGLQLDHLCRNRPCVNPYHVEPVTPRVNTMRGDAPSSLNARKTHCKRNHEFTPENTYVKKDGARWCRICRDAASRKHKESRIGN